MFAFACRDRLEPGNPARPAWSLLSAGLFATLVGQLSLAPFQLVSGQTPFPSMGDIYFLLSYPFLIAAFLVLPARLPRGGLPGRLARRARGDPRRRRAGRRRSPRSTSCSRCRDRRRELLDRILNVAYPVLDLVLLLPLTLLLRIVLRLRGSHVGAVWTGLLAGFVFLCLGDIFFAYFSALGEQHLDPFVHATFILSYGLIAGGRAPAARAAQELAACRRRTHEPLNVYDATGA